MTINRENFKILRDAVKANQRFSMQQFVHHGCGTAACILGTAGALLDIKPDDIDEGNEQIAEWLGIDGGDMFHIAYGDWTETPLDEITQEQAIEYLNKVIDFGYVDVGKTKFTMQELLDHARSPAAVYDPIPNPWKWDTEAEKWTAIDEEGGLWESEADEITAVQVGWV